MKKIFNTVLFDLDGTLLDTNRLILESFAHSFGNLYGEVPDQKILTGFFGMTLHEALSHLSRRPEDIEPLLLGFREYNLKHHDQYVSVFPGAEETFRALKDHHYKIGIVTSKLNKTARRGLALFDLEKYVDICIGADDTPLHKPDPLPVLTALAKLNRKGSESVMVGDSLHDMVAGRKSGCQTVFVTYSVVQADNIKEYSDYQIDHLTELTDILGIV